MGIGVHQDGGRRMTRVALHRLEVAVRLQELVGGTGVPQTVEHDLLKLRVLGSPQAVPLCQQLRRDGQVVRGEKCAVLVKQLVGAQKIVTEQGFVEKALLEPCGGKITHRHSILSLALQKNNVVNLTTLFSGN